MRILAAFLASLALTSPALAGGIGFIGTAGFHNEPVFYYDRSNDLAQYQMNQLIPNYGAGLELVLGDRDDRILGTLRGYWTQDGPQTAPAASGQLSELVAPADVVAAHRSQAKNIGMASVGIQWGFYGNPDTFQLNAVAGVGSGFLTTDHTEFLFVEGGLGAHYQVARSAQIFGNALYSMRWRKGAQHGPIVYAGIRYLFD